MGLQWHQSDHMQIICTSLQSDNHASTSPLSFYRPDALATAQPTASKRQNSKGTLRSSVQKRLNQMGTRNHVLDGGPDPPWEGLILRGKGAAAAGNKL